METYSVEIPIQPDKPLDNNHYLDLSPEGMLTIKKGYAWDGATGVPDIASMMRGALVHDALYQLMREGCLNKDQHRDPADRLLQKMCKEDGMIAAVAWIVYIGVKQWGDPAADPKNRKPFLKAPKSCR